MALPHLSTWLSIRERLHTYRYDRHDLHQDVPFAWRQCIEEIQYASAAAAMANEELVRCYEAASILVDFGADTLVTSPDMMITIDEISKTLSSGNKSVVVVPGSASSLSVSAMVPKAMGSTAGRGYAINVETFITKERALLESYAAVLVYARKPATDMTQSVKAAMAKGGEEGLAQQPKLKDSIRRKGSVEGLIGLYGAIRSLYILLIAVETRGLKQFISTRSSSSSSNSATAVVEPDVLQEIFKQAEKECTNSIAVLEASIVSVLLSPLHCAVTSFVRMPSLLIGKDTTTTTGTANPSNPGGLKITAQSTNYSTGDAVYSPVSQSMCDFLLEVPDIVEALAVNLERAASTTAADDASSTTSPSVVMSSAIVPALTTTTLLTSILNETQSNVVHRLCTELVAVHSRQSLEQLAVDLDYITPVVEAVRDEGGAGGSGVGTGCGDDRDEDAVGGKNSTPADQFDGLVKRVRDANDALTDASNNSPSSNLFPFYFIGHAPEQHRTATAATASSPVAAHQKRH